MSKTPLKDMIRMVNGRVNTREGYATDIELYQMPEFWSFASIAGECNDYAITKALMLLDDGFPVENLRLATCWIEEKGKPRTYHAVLIATVEDGDWILDSNFFYIVRLPDTGYLLDKVQVPGTDYWQVAAPVGSKH